MISERRNHSTRKVLAKSSIADGGSFVVGGLIGALAIGNLIQGAVLQILPINVTLLAGVSLALCVLMRRARRAMHGGRHLVLFVIVMALGYLTPQLNPSAADKRVLIITAVMAPVFVAALVSARWDLSAVGNRTMKGLVGAVVLASFITLALMFVAPDPEALAVGRRAPLGVNAISAGRLLCAAALLTLVSAFAAQRALMRLLFALFSASFIFASLLTSSRGPLLALAVSILFVIVASGRTISRRLRVAAVVVTSAAVIFLLRRGIELDDRLSSFDGNGRGGLQSTAVEQMTTQPFGIGWGNLYNYLSPSDALAAQGYDQYPHNLFLEVGSEAGLLALGLLIIILVRAARTPRMLDSPEGIGLASLTFFALVGAMFSSSILGNVLLWVLLGVLLGSPRGMHPKGESSCVTDEAFAQVTPLQLRDDPSRSARPSAQRRHDPLGEDDAGGSAAHT